MLHVKHCRGVASPPAASCYPLPLAAGFRIFSNSYFFLSSGAFPPLIKQRPTIKMRLKEITSHCVVKPRPSITPSKSTAMKTPMKQIPLNTPLAQSTKVTPLLKKTTLDDQTLSTPTTKPLKRASPVTKSSKITSMKRSSETTPNKKTTPVRRRSSQLNFKTTPPVKKTLIKTPVKKMKNALETSSKILTTQASNPVSSISDTKSMEWQSNSTPADVISVSPSSNFSSETASSVQSSPRVGSLRYRCRIGNTRTNFFQLIFLF